MAPLDLFGPIQVFNVACVPHANKPRMPDTTKPLYRVITIGTEKGPIATGREGAGPVVVADHYIDDDVDFDILLIPGGGGTRALVNDRGFVDSLTAACKKAKIIASVCTGAALLSKTGLLDQKPATSNKTAWSWVVEQRKDVDWDSSPRWVDLIDKETQTGIITSAGVSAGIDMALALVADLDGEQVADNAAVFIEHNRVKNPASDVFAYLADEK
jgi:putative intracellular protease/amidase